MRLSMRTTFGFQTSDISRALTLSCCLPVEKVAPGVRLLQDNVLRISVK